MTRRDVWMIAAIWIVAVTAGGSIMGETPTVDEEVYGTALILIVGGLLTGVYFIVRETRTKKRTGRLSLTSDSEQDTSRRSRAWLGLVDVAAVLILWAVGYRIAVLWFSETTSEVVGALLPIAFLLVRQVWRSRRSTA